MRRAVELRAATDDDLPAVRTILAAHGNDGPIVFGDVVGPYLRHLFRYGRSIVAVDGDQIVAIGAAIETGRGMHLADLFVRPERLGQGIGRPLLEAVFENAERRTTFASDDPRAIPIYIRAGMRPWWASLYLEGVGDGLPRAPVDITTREASATELANVERSWAGHDRSVDWSHWTTQVAADNFVVLLGDKVVGVASARARQASPVRALSRLVVHPDAGVDPVAVSLAAIRRAARDGVVLATIQGPSPVLRPLLEHGFRIADHDQFMASAPDLVDPARLIPNSGML